MHLRRPFAGVAFGLAALIGLAGCLPIGGQPPRVAQAAGDLVFVGTPDGVAALDMASGRVAFTARHGVATPDWSRLFAVRAGADGAEYQDRLGILDGRTGAEQHALFLPKGLAASVASPGGRLVALVEPREGHLGPDPYTPVGRERTTLVVADLATADTRHYELAGNYEPEAFSLDDRTLFLIEHLPAQQPDRYRVRQMDLASGVTSPVGGIKGPLPEEEMRGQGRLQVLSPDRKLLYTLYTHQPEHLHARDLARGQRTARGDVHAFVHVLSLADNWAFCLDLPAPFGLGPAAAHTLAVSPDGRRLYVADRSSGAVALAEVSTLPNITRLVNVGADLRRGRATAAAQVSPDGGTLYLAGSSELLALDSRSLAPRQRWPLAGTVTGLGASPDGQRLYLGLEGRVVVLDAASGEGLGEIPLPGVQGIKHVRHAPELAAQT